MMFESDSDDDDFNVIDDLSNVHSKILILFVHYYFLLTVM